MVVNTNHKFGALKTKARDVIKSNCNKPDNLGNCVHVKRTLKRGGVGLTLSEVGGTSPPFPKFLRSVHKTLNGLFSGMPFLKN